MKRLIVVFFALILTLTWAKEHEHKPIKPELHAEELTEAGEHNPEYDSESVLGEDKEQFSELDQEEAKEKLGEYITKIDENHDGQVSSEELIKWIMTSYKHVDRAATDKTFDEHDTDHDDKLTWNEVHHYAVGHTPEELEKLVLTKDEDAVSINKQVVPFERAKFELADANKDKALNKDEFFPFVHPQNIKEMSDIETNKTFADMDKNKNGKIEFDEYLLSYNYDEPEKHRETELANFKEHDSNKNDLLDFDEVRKWMVPDYDVVSSLEVKHIFEETDKDKDGTLSREEILNEVDLFTGQHITRTDHDEL